MSQVFIGVMLKIKQKKIKSQEKAQLKKGCQGRQVLGADAKARMERGMSHADLWTPPTTLGPHLSQQPCTAFQAFAVGLLS